MPTQTTHTTHISILGCGASGGVPLIGCACAVCCSQNSKNTRRRASILLENNHKRLLVDASPDLHDQAVDANLKIIDAICFTHAHADHTHGIDDLRAFNYHRNDVLDCYADAPTLAELTQRFSYAFLPPKPEYGWFRPALRAHEVRLGQAQEMAGMHVQTFTQDHGRVETMGIRVGNFAYSTDVKSLDEAAFNTLKGVEIWVVDCLQDSPTLTHADLELTLGWIARVQPKRAVLTHMSHWLEYETLKQMLPDAVEPAYDGMQLQL